MFRAYLANIFMTELEITVVVNLCKYRLLKFYFLYIYGTMALIKESDIHNVLSKFNNFHPSLNFTVVHYLHLKIIDNKADIYYKDTHTGQYMHFSSCAPWNTKTA